MIGAWADCLDARPVTQGHVSAGESPGLRPWTYRAGGEFAMLNRATGALCVEITKKGVPLQERSGADVVGLLPIQYRSAHAIAESLARLVYYALIGVVFDKRKSASREAEKREVR